MPSFLQEHGCTQHRRQRFAKVGRDGPDALAEGSKVLIAWPNHWQRLLRQSDSCTDSCSGINLRSHLHPSIRKISSQLVALRFDDPSLRDLNVWGVPHRSSANDSGGFMRMSKRQRCQTGHVMSARHEMSSDSKRAASDAFRPTSSTFQRAEPSRSQGAPQPIDGRCHSRGLLILQERPESPEGNVVVVLRAQTAFVLEVGIRTPPRGFERVAAIAH